MKGGLTCLFGVPLQTVSVYDTDSDARCAIATIVACDSFFIESYHVNVNLIQRKLLEEPSFIFHPTSDMSYVPLV